MLQALIIYSREGFEAFLIIAIIAAWLRKTERTALLPALYSGIAVAVTASCVLGYILVERGMDPVWEGALGLLAVATVISLVIHMWRTAPQMKSNMEKRLTARAHEKSTRAAFWGVFAFTVFMITREGIESALMSFQMIQQSASNYLGGILLGLGLAALLSWAWGHFGHRINIKLFFRVTGVYLILFALQLAVYAVHELAEGGVFPNSSAFENATEVFSPDGTYGKWFSLIMIGACAIWFAFMWITERSNHSRLAHNAPKS